MLCHVIVINLVSLGELQIQKARRKRRAFLIDNARHWRTHRRANDKRIVTRYAM